MTDQVGTLPGYGLVWYAKDVITNALLFTNVFDSYNVDLIKKDKRVFIIWALKNDIAFKQHSSGLYYHKVGNRKFVLPHRKY